MNRNKVIELYTLNAGLCESLYTSLHMFEVVLRNSVHQVMAVAHGDAWYANEAFQANPVQADMLAKARKPEAPGWLSPVAAQWCRDCSRFGLIYP